MECLGPSGKFPTRMVTFSGLDIFLVQRKFMCRNRADHMDPRTPTSELMSMMIRETGTNRVETMVKVVIFTPLGGLSDLRQVQSQCKKLRLTRLQSLGV